MTAVRYQISGTVQGVGYRYFVLRRAGSLGLGGWVRNLSDGTVEVVARGSRDALEALEALLREGPPRAEVGKVAVEPISDEVNIPISFEVR